LSAGYYAYASEVEPQNTMSIEVKSIDSTFEFIAVDVEVALFLPSGEGSRHLVLPFKYNQSIGFFIEPKSTNNTLLSGFLNGGYGNFLIQIELMDKPSEIHITIKNVRLPIMPTSDPDSLGYYSIPLNSIIEGFSDYVDSMIYIDRTRLKDERLVLSRFLIDQPNAVVGSEKHTVELDIDQGGYAIIAFISKEMTGKTSWILSILITIAGTLLGIVAGFSIDLDKRIAAAKIWVRNTLRVGCLLFLIGQIVLFFVFTLPTGNYNELSFMSLMSTLFGASIGFCIIVFYQKRKSRPNSAS